jgi:hypothetical protein
MYCLGASEKYEQMSPDKDQQIGFEVAMLGMNGIDVNDPTRNILSIACQGPTVDCTYFVWNMYPSNNSPQSRRSDLIFQRNITQHKYSLRKGRIQVNNNALDRISVQVVVEKRRQKWDDPPPSGAWSLPGSCASHRDMDNHPGSPLLCGIHFQVTAE